MQRLTFTAIFFLSIFTNCIAIENNYFLSLKNKNDPCLKCFYQTEPSDEILNCEFEGILGPVAGIVGNIQGIEVLKNILNLSKESNKKILVLDFLNLNFRKAEFNKKKNCVCKNF